MGLADRLLELSTVSACRLGRQLLGQRTVWLVPETGTLAVNGFQKQIFEGRSRLENWFLVQTRVVLICNLLRETPHMAQPQFWLIIVV